MNNDINNQNMNPAGINPNPVDNQNMNPAGINPNPVDNQNMNPAGINPNPVDNQNMNPAGINPNPVNNQNMNPAGINPNPVNNQNMNPNNKKNKISFDKKMIIKIAVGIGAFILGFLLVKSLLGGAGYKKLTGMAKYLPDGKYNELCEMKNSSDENVDLTVVVGISENKSKGYITVNMVNILAAKNGEALESTPERDKYVEEYRKEVNGDKYEYRDGKIIISRFGFDPSTTVDELKSGLISQGFSCK